MRKSINNCWRSILKEKLELIKFCFLDKYDAPSGTFRRWLAENYYNLPWERTAEIFGGVNNAQNGYLPYSDKIAWAYFMALMLI